MKHSILRALPEHAAMMDASVMAAIEAYCTPENIGAVVHQATTEAINAAVKEEVRRFFEWSNPGRRAVRDAVIKHMDEWDKNRSGIGY
jgi:hypothetical protein